MAVLITGGAGFIGSHLSELFLAKGEEVYILDDLSTGSVENIKHLKSNSKFHPVYESVMNSQILRELVDESDTIVHLAAAVGVKLVVDSPVNTIERNVNGTENVLKYADFKKKRVIVASTSEVYGKSEKETFKEDDDLIIGPSTINRWSYACSKLLDEFLALAYHKERNVPVTVVRFFNTVGPRQASQYGMVIPRFIKQAINGDDLTVYGDGKQTRCFTYVKDAVKAIDLLLQSDRSVGEIFNIGNPEEVDIMELANRIRSAVGTESKIEMVPYEDVYGSGFEDMRRRVPDITKISEFTSYRPEFNLDALIAETVEYFKSVKK